MAEERDPQDSPVGDLLDEWREAERDAAAEEPDSAARKMAQQRVNHARHAFHEAEDEAREESGNHRPRKHPDPPP